MSIGTAPPPAEVLQALASELFDWLKASEEAARILRSYGISPNDVKPNTLEEFRAAVGSTNYRMHLVELFEDYRMDQRRKGLTLAERVTLAYKPEAAKERLSQPPGELILE